MQITRFSFVFVCGFFLSLSFNVGKAQNQGTRIGNFREQRRMPGPQVGFRQNMASGPTRVFQRQQQRMRVQGQPSFRQPLMSNRQQNGRRPLINFASSNNPTLLSSRAVLRVGSPSQGIPNMGRQQLPRTRQSMRSLQPFQNNRMSVCRQNEALRCRNVPPNVSQRNVQRCNGNCPGRTCIVNCICTCTRTGNGNRRGGLPAQRGGRGSFGSRQQPGPGFNRRRSGNGLRRGMNLPGAARGTGNNGLDFGLNDSTLASLLAQPDLLNLVGPQGINDILAGVPPSLLPTINDQATGGRQLSVNSLQQDLRAISARDAARQREAARAGRRGQTDMGIPIPLSLQSLAPPPMSEADILTSMIALSDSGPFESLRDLIMPSATIDNSVRVQPNSGTDTNLRSGRTETLQTGGIMGNVQNGGVIRPTSFDLGIATPRGMEAMPGSKRIVSQSNAAHLTGNHPQIEQIIRPEVVGTSGASAIQNFLQVSAPSVGDRQTSGAPTSDECLATRRELWCNSIGVWDGTPGLDRWCLLNCRSNNCDTTRCLCSCVEEEVFRIRNAQLSRGALL